MVVIKNNPVIHLLDPSPFLHYAISVYMYTARNGALIAELLLLFEFCIFSHVNVDHLISIVNILT